MDVYVGSIDVSEVNTCFMSKHIIFSIGYEKDSGIELIHIFFSNLRTIITHHTYSLECLKGLYYIIIKGHVFITTQRILALRISAYFIVSGNRGHIFHFNM